MSKVAEPWSARQQRQLAFISEYTTHIQHVAGKDNVDADCLSRAIIGAVQLDVDYARMSADQTSDRGVQALRASDTSLRLEEVALVTQVSDLSSDRGPQFTSELWNAVAEGLGVKLHRTTAYHPQANGLIERFHRSMKVALRSSLTDGNWVDKLPWVLLGLRCAPKEDLQSSSAELVYGQTLRVPGDFIPSTTARWSVAGQRATLLEAAKAFTPVPTSQHGAPAFCVPPHLQSADFVFVRHDAHRGPLAPPLRRPV